VTARARWRAASRQARATVIQALLDTESDLRWNVEHAGYASGRQNRADLAAAEAAAHAARLLSEIVFKKVQ
jgi:hypothetical protein